MKIIFWKTRGLNDKSKLTTLKHFIQNQHPNLVLIQETKCQEFDQQFLKALWSSNGIGWISVEAYGKSKGLLLMWDESKVTPLELLKGGYSLSIKFMTLCKNICWVTNVYGAKDYRERHLLWPYSHPYFITVLNYGV